MENYVERYDRYSKIKGNYKDIEEFSHLLSLETPRFYKSEIEYFLNQLPKKYKKDILKEDSKYAIDVGIGLLYIKLRIKNSDIVLYTYDLFSGNKITKVKN